VYEMDVSGYTEVSPDKSKLNVFVLVGPGSERIPDLTVFCESEEKYTVWLNALSAVVGPRVKRYGSEMWKGTYCG
jgi:hypothetical protein